MALPTKEEAQRLLENHVKDEYQRYHAKMVATAMEGYAPQFGNDPLPWYVTGLCDGEAAFTYSRTNSGKNLGLYFSIKLSNGEAPLLAKLRAFFGAGLIYKVKARAPRAFSGRTGASLLYRVSRLNELALVIAHFDAFPPRGRKAQAYRLWREMYRVKREGRHGDKTRLFELASALSSLSTKNRRAR